MNKKQKQEYIESVRARIEDAPNHGHQGNNWWYPTPWTVAYDVKIHSRTKDIDDVRARMTAIQNKYCNDDTIYSLYYDQLELACRSLEEDLDSMPLVQGVRFAGRSGGWCEVTYTGFEDTSYSDEWTTEDWNSLYADAVALSDAESAVHEYIEKAHKGLCEYLNSEQYVTDCIESLLTDDEIVALKQSEADVYKSLA